MAQDRVVVRMLGPLMVDRAAGQTPVRGRQQAAVLALLAVDLGRVVPSDTLVEQAWRGDPPPTAAAALRVHVSQLRRLLGTAAPALRHLGNGYVLEAGPVTTDCARLDECAREAAALLPTQHVQRAQLLREGLALWRGAPLAGLEDVEPLAQEARRLEELRLGMQEDCVAALLALGEHAAACAAAARLVAQSPLREVRTAHLMLALYRTGRQADALAASSALRARLADELGLDPSPALQRLEGAVLRQEPHLDLAPSDEQASPAPYAHDRVAPGLVDLVAFRTADLSPAGLRVLHVLAVLGRPASATELARLCGQSPADADTCLAEGVAAGVLVAVQGQVALRRPELAQAVLTGLDAGRRRAVQAEVGRALLRSGRSEDTTAAAHHLLRAGDRVPAVDAARAAVLGADAALRGDDPAAAAQLVRAALRLLDDAAVAAGPGIDLCLRLALAEARQHRLAEADAAWSTALALARRCDDVGRLALCVLARDWHRRTLMAPDDDRALLREVLDRLGPRPSALRVRVASALLTETAVPGRTQALQSLADEVARTAPAVGDVEAHLAALHARHVLLRADPDRAARALARDAFGRHAADGSGPWWRAVAELAGLFDALVDADGEAVTAALTAFGTHVGEASHVRLEWHLGLVRAVLSQLQGDWATADRHADEAAVTGAAAGIPDALPAAVVHQFVTRLHTSSVVPLTGLLERYAADQPTNQAAVGASALACAEAGRAVDAQRLVGRTLALAGVTWDEASTLACALAARAAVRSGSTPDVREELAALLLPYSGQVVVFGQVTAVLGPVDAALALLCAEAGDLARAGELARRAVATSRRLGSRLWTARCGVEAALVHQRAGQGEQAERLARALAGEVAALSLRPCADALTASGLLRGASPSA